MTTEAYAQQLLAEAPLTRDGAYVAQSQQYLSDVAPRIWEALWRALQPFSGESQPTLRPLEKEVQQTRSMYSFMQYGLLQLSVFYQAHF